MFNLVLIAVTYYAYYELKARGTLGLVSLDPESETMRDPLIFIAPALFILTSGWLLSQVFRLLLRIPDVLGSLLPGVSVYMSLRNLARHSGAYTAPIFLLTICLCLGSFEVSIAKSADRLRPLSQLRAERPAKRSRLVRAWRDNMRSRSV